MNWMYMKGCRNNENDNVNMTTSTWRRHHEFDRKSRERMTFDNPSQQRPQATITSRSYGGNKNKWVLLSLIYMTVIPLNCLRAENYYGIYSTG